MAISDEMRDAWADYACDRDSMTRIDFGPDSILVAPETVEAWKALESILLSHGYDLRVDDTDSYNCRDVKSGGKKSLHSYGIALDINWQTNPYLDHAGNRNPRFSDKDTQAERAQDVKLGKSDTDMTRAMVEAALAIATKDGKRVFGWGGNWKSLKDAMHFQIEVTPEDLSAGIDWDTVEDGGALVAPDTEDLDIEPFDTPISDHGGIEMGLPKIFFDTVRGPLFSGSLSQTAVDNMTTIIQYWRQNFPTNPINQLAYILATVRAEVGAKMHPVREGFASSDAGARHHVRNRRYGRPAGPYGHVYYGRGYVQLTWHENYQKQSRKLGIDLEQFPDEALRPEIGIHILVRGMMDGDFNGRGHGLPFYVNEAKQDFVNARRTVNVLDRASEIAGFANVFLSALQRAQAEAGLDFGVSAHAMASTMRPVEAIPPGMAAFVPSHSPTPHSPPPFTQPIVQPAQPVDSIQESALGTLLAGMQPSEYRILLSALGVDDATRTKFEEVLGALEKAGVIKPANGLTPVNGALGETVGKLLDGKKTVLGVLLMIVSIFMPQLAPAISAVTGIAETAGSIAGQGQGQGLGATLKGMLLPLASLLTGWGALGKIDKWMHKPKVNALSNVLSKFAR